MYRITRTYIDTDNGLTTMNNVIHTDSIETYRNELLTQPETIGVRFIYETI